MSRAVDFDPGKLTAARLDIRSDKECDVQRRIQSACGDKYNLLMRMDSKRDVAAMLNKDTGRQPIRAQL